MKKYLLRIILCSTVIITAIFSVSYLKEEFIDVSSNSTHDIEVALTRSFLGIERKVRYGGAYGPNVKFAYALFHQLNDVEETQPLNPDEIKVPEAPFYTIGLQNEEVQEMAVSIFDSFVQSDQYFNDRSGVDIDYYALNHLTGDSIDTSEGFLKDVNDSNYQDKYLNYIIFHFDENGNYTYEYNDSGQNLPQRFEDEDYLSYLTKELSYRIVIEYNDNQMNNDIPYLDDSTSIELMLRPITNMTFALGVDKYIQPNSLLENKINIDLHDSLFSTNKAISTLLMSAFMLIGLILPIKKMNEIGFFKFMSKIYFEVYCVVGFYFVIYFMSPWTLTYGIMENAIAGYSSIESLFLIMTVVVIVEIVVGLIVGFMLKYLVATGIINYLKQHSLIIKVVMKIKDKIFDLSDYFVEAKKNKVLLAINMIVIGHGVIIYILFVYLITGGWSYFSLTSIILVGGPTLLILIAVQKIYQKTMKDYRKLSNITTRMAGGDLNVEAIEDLGIFNGLKGELSNIRIGFKKAVGEEVKAQNMRTELITNVSHDLKTPLTNIITYTELLNTQKTDKATREEYLAIIDRNSKRLKKLVEDLFEVSKINSGNIELDLQDVDIVSMINQEYVEWQQKYEERSLNTRFNFVPEKAIVKLDAFKSHRIFENLFSNINKYALDNTRVYIDVISEDGKCKITFRNISANEITVPSEDIAERFVRGDEARNTEGSGLGLAIAKNLTEIHEGIFNIIIDGDLFKVEVIFDLAQ